MEQQLDNKKSREELDNEAEVYFGEKGLSFANKEDLSELNDFVEDKANYRLRGVYLREVDVGVSRHSDRMAYMEKVVISWLQKQGRKFISVTPKNGQINKEIVFIEILEEQESIGIDKDGQEIFSEASRLPRVFWELSGARRHGQSSDIEVSIDYMGQEVLFIKDKEGQTYLAEERQYEDGKEPEGSSFPFYYVRGEKIETLAPVEV